MEWILHKKLSSKILSTNYQHIILREHICWLMLPTLRHETKRRMVKLKLSSQKTLLLSCSYRTFRILDYLAFPRFWTNFCLVWLRLNVSQNIRRQKSKNGDWNFDKFLWFFLNYNIIEFICLFILRLLLLVNMFGCQLFVLDFKNGMAALMSFVWTLHRHCIDFLLEKILLCCLWRIKIRIPYYFLLYFHLILISPYIVVCMASVLHVIAACTVMYCSFSWKIVHESCGRIYYKRMVKWYRSNNFQDNSLTIVVLTAGPKWTGCNAMLDARLFPKGKPIADQSIDHLFMEVSGCFDCTRDYSKLHSSLYTLYPNLSNGTFPMLYNNNEDLLLHNCFVYFFKSCLHCVYDTSNICIYGV